MYYHNLRQPWLLSITVSIKRQLYEVSFTLVLPKTQNKHINKQTDEQAKKKNGKTKENKLYGCPHKTRIIASNLLLFYGILHDKYKENSLSSQLQYLPTYCLYLTHVQKGNIGGLATQSRG